ncbi:DUF1285 domain-containing protein [Aestuariibacter sp. AA17]|uniref:DUF1285 domain-containing protein n=1 Tax=Fluctibacter corallii TaxID=2984329 RepID=A0ABT3AB73_9ALTE|nr:DUF1285 domain-containing protein [Aestuariibacter sp. AA17]MCV2885883.1 DUF1285 domain-containing protein [Aestuariibacter sp. AA17]
MDIQSLQTQLKDSEGSTPPVEMWNPDFCGDIDIIIKHDGTWFYMGTPIGRKPLVKLFSSVLKKEGEKYFLVTPVEKVGIEVEDVPFLITQWELQDNQIIFSTHTQDTFVVNDSHPVELHTDKVTGALLPYVLVRRNLWARLHQNVFYQMVEAADETTFNGKQAVTVSSGDYQIILGYI